ncbi:MAG: adenylate/guanylate cyclase domain-containing protein [Candidatus Limnocylindria bacterium]
MDCPSCGKANTATAKFCVECGTPMATACPSCGTTAAPGAKFCAECGAGLGTGTAPAASTATTSATTPPATSEAAVAERRLVSVLFADLVGFTTLSENRDPEETRELLTRYFETARTVIERYGGTVEKFIGDAVMAVWGTPITHEDDAERAVRSALELVEAVRVLGEDAGAAGLQARAGVLTGEAAVTLGASYQGMVAGDLVNTAARLQSAAEPGTVFVGDGTHHATSNAIGYEPAGDHVMKGKAEPVTAYRAVRVFARRGGEGRTAQLEAPFTGRQSELRLLKDFLHATASEQRARVASVMGQGGIGKSRLAWEFQKYIDGLTEDVYWHHGRCPAYGEGVSFWALGEMVRARAGILEGETGESASSKLVASLEDFVPDEAERRWIEPAMRGLLGLDSSEASVARQQEALFSAWRTYFERIAERGTTVLVFEDLQWADAGLLDFIEHLLEWSRSRPIYVITLARPELLDRRPGWGAGWRNFTSVFLEPLDDESMRELLAGLVPGLPDAVSERILARAEGVPLYAVETIRMLLAEGKIEPHGDAFRPVGDLSELAVPETLQGLVSARLDGLPAEDRLLVQEASVLGKTFNLEAAADVAGVDASALEGRLRDLVKRELFVLDIDPRSPERGQYGFVQALVREVAYGTLARADRRRLHLAAAQHYERSDDEELAGVLATHYLAAYRAKPDGPEGEAVAAQARVALRAAGERATKLGSYGVALRYVEQALEVARDDSERSELHLTAGNAATELTDTALATEHLERAIELSRAAGDRAGELRCMVAMGLMRTALGHSEAAVPPLEEAAERFSDLDTTAEYVQLTEALSRAYMRTLRHDESLTWVERGLREAERREMTRVTLELLVTRGTVLSVRGRLKESAATLIGARQLAAAEGYHDIEVRALVNIGFATQFDDPRTGLQASLDGAEIAMRMGLGSFLAYMVGNAAEIGLQAGTWDVSRDLIARVLALELGDEAAGHIRGHRAILAAMSGEPYQDDLDAAIASTAPDDAQARAQSATAEAFIHFIHGRFSEASERARAVELESEHAVSADMPLLIGRGGLWSGDVSEIHDLLAQIAESPGRVFAAVRAELSAGAAALTGDRPAATAGFIEAVRRWRDLRLDFQRAQSQITMVATLGAGPDTADAEAEARATFEKLGARQAIALLDAAKTVVRPPAQAVRPHPTVDQRVRQTTG